MLFNSVFEMESSRWTSEICSLKEKQKRQYVDKVMKLYERLQIEHTSGNDRFETLLPFFMFTTSERSVHLYCYNVV